MNLRGAVKQAEEKGVAIGHFNFSNLGGLWGIFHAAKELDVPVIVGTSEGERAFVGPTQAVALVKSIREQFDYPIFLNADHTYDLEKIKEAAEAGYDSIIYDGAKLPYEENLQKTKEAVEVIKSINPDIIVEAELGYIGTSSKLLDEIPKGAEVTEDSLTDPDQAKDFVERTGVDMLAPGVGNLHGMLKDAKNPSLSIERIRQIREAAGVPLVLHGGSGISDEDFREAIKAGISVVHINTEIRVAYREGLEKALEEDPDQISPYKYLDEPRDALGDVVKKRLELFNFIG
tara:strand:- start:3321 stop:4187 length:867 start_codon:yes stop_codon:yes gene_type:complete